MQDDQFNLLYNEIKCSICLDIYKDPSTTQCSHTFCNDCITNYLKMQGQKNKCPLCVKTISKSELRKDRKTSIFVQIYNKIEKEKIIQYPNNSQIMQHLSAQKLNPQDQDLLSQNYQLSKQYLNQYTDDEQRQSQFQQYLTQTAQKRKEEEENRKNEEFHILASNMTENFQEEIDKFCQVYPKAQLHKTFNNKITHLIVNPEVQTQNKIQAVRSVKYLQCVLKGTWVVSIRWIVNSNGYGYIQSERDHEITCDKKAKNAAKISRVMKGLSNIFEGLKFYVVEAGFKNLISKKDLQNLIELGGGEIILREQNFIKRSESFEEDQEKQYFYVVIIPDEQNIQSKISPKKVNPNAVLIKHNWILDSISNAKILSCAEYF